MDPLYIALAVGYTLVDRAAFAVSGAPTARERREWTYWAVTGPYMACLVGPAVELAAGNATPTLPGMIAGTVLVVASAAVRWVGVTTLGASFSAAVETHEEHALVDRGIYRLIRHPLYLALAMLFVGLPLAAGARLTWIATAVGLAGLVARVHAEERWLSAELDGYAQYMRRTKRLLPGIW